MIRLDKFLCDCGAGSRSQVKVMLKNGRVTVDGKQIKDPACKIFEGAAVCLDGEILTLQGRIVLMLNKPAGYITATKDEKDKTIMELLPKNLRHLNPVGRLDKDTEGLLLFTDDGDLLHRLITPKKQVQKIYYARHEGTATEEDVEAFSQGLTLGDGTKCLPAKLESLGAGESLITVCEGKYHQVRRMMASRQMPVSYLERRQEGALTLGELSRGEYRILTNEEVCLLEK